MTCRVRARIVIGVCRTESERLTKYTSVSTEYRIAELICRRRIVPDGSPDCIDSRQIPNSFGISSARSVQARIALSIVEATSAA